jgi:hypothetical protein
MDGLELPWQLRMGSVDPSGARIPDLLARRGALKARRRATTPHPAVADRGAVSWMILRNSMSQVAQAQAPSSPLRVTLWGSTPNLRIWL